MQIIEMGDYVKANHRIVFHVDTQSFVFTSLSVSVVQFVTMAGPVSIVSEQ